MIFTRPTEMGMAIFTGVRVKTTMSLKYPKMSDFLLLDTYKSTFIQTGLVKDEDDSNVGF
jgi:hypothetical protein